MALGKRQVLVLYGSQTGNAQDVSERIGREAVRRHYVPRVVSMGDYDPAQLPEEEFVIFVAATTGQGDPPDNMKKFWKGLLRKSLQATWLSFVTYAVFGLGDSGYQKYNMVAKKLDRRLADLGAAEILPRGLGDDQHPSGYEAVLDPWLVSLWAALRKRVPLPPGLFDVPPDSTAVPSLDSPKLRVTYHARRVTRPKPSSQKSFATTAGGMTHSLSTVSSRAEAEEILSERVAAVAALDSSTSVSVAGVSVPHDVGYGPRRPYLARMVTNTRITAGDHEQDVRHIELELGDSGLQYEPGDLLHVVPEQPPDIVESFLVRCGLDGDMVVTVEAADTWQKGGESGSKAAKGSNNISVRIRDLVAATLDINSASPRRYFFEVLSHFATAEHEKERLQFFSMAEGRDELYQYNQRERRTVLEVLEDFPSARMPLEWLLQTVPRLQARAFSISSSPRAHEGQAHITLAVVRWHTPFRRTRLGLCSHWLSHLNPSNGLAFVPVWISRGAFRLPREPSVPLILVGPGTGVAPLRSFVHHRSVLSPPPPVAPGPVALFFGCRFEAKDFLYREEWHQLSMPGGGPLAPDAGGQISVAFSRDQPKKVYVQHKLEEHSGYVWSLLQKGAAVYVSGSASKMPADVASAFERIAVREGNMTPAEATAWLRNLERRGFYNVEAWS